MEGGIDSPLGKLVVSAIYEGGSADKHGEMLITAVIRSASGLCADHQNFVKRV